MITRSMLTISTFMPGSFAVLASLVGSILTDDVSGWSTFQDSLGLLHELSGRQGESTRTRMLGCGSIQSGRQVRLVRVPSAVILLSRLCSCIIDSGSFVVDVATGNSLYGAKYTASWSALYRGLCVGTDFSLFLQINIGTDSCATWASSLHVRCQTRGRAFSLSNAPITRGVGSQESST